VAKGLQSAAAAATAPTWVHGKWQQRRQLSAVGVHQCRLLPLLHLYLLAAGRHVGFPLSRCLAVCCRFALCRRLTLQCRLPFCCGLALLCTNGGSQRKPGWQILLAGLCLPCSRRCRACCPWLQSCDVERRFQP
jgi:hypothetical protein